jgi:thiol-disulfide isomerase/thioredoxin
VIKEMGTLFYVSYVALWLLVLSGGVLILLLYRHFGLMALGTVEGVQRDGLPVGEVAPPVTAVTADGTTTTWTPARGQRHLVLFAALGCGPCAAVMPAVNRLAKAANGHRIEVMAIVDGRPEDAAELKRQFALLFPCLAENGRGAVDRYRVRVTPFAFVIGEDGRVLAKGLCNEAARLRDLLVAGGVDDGAMLIEPPIHLDGARRSAAIGIQEVKR